MSKKNYLITGGAGFIGNHVIRYLLKNKNARVTCIDNFDAFYSREIKLQNISDLQESPDFKLIENNLDVLNASSLNKLIAEPIDVIIHLAAKAGVRPSIQDPKPYIKTNVTATQSLLEFAVQKNVGKFIFASSSSVYGNNKHLPWKEDEVLYPISPYAATKLSGEAFGHVYSNLYHLPFVALRLFTVYGPCMRPDLAIYQFTKSILEGTPITLFGDGLSSRDYTFIKDIVKGIVEAVELDAQFEVINLGNSQTVYLKELIEKIEEVAGKEAIIKWRPMQPGDVSYTYADITKAEWLLNYHPETGIDEGLQEVYQWFKKHEELLLTH